MTPHSSEYHRPMKPTWVELDEPKTYDRYTVDEDDLFQCFKRRVTIRRALNTDTNVITRHAYFDPPLTPDEIQKIKRLSDQFQRRRETHRSPLYPPRLKKSS